jgi:hypothetical protein
MKFPIAILKYVSYRRDSVAANESVAEKIKAAVPKITW